MASKKEFYILVVKDCISVNAEFLVALGAHSQHFQSIIERPCNYVQADAGIFGFLFLEGIPLQRV